MEIAGSPYKGVSYKGVTGGLCLRCSYLVVADQVKVGSLVRLGWLSFVEGLFYFNFLFCFPQHFLAIMPAPPLRAPLLDDGFERICRQPRQPAEDARTPSYAEGCGLVLQPRRRIAKGAIPVEHLRAGGLEQVRKRSKVAVAEPRAEPAQISPRDAQKIVRARLPRRDE